jgi:hypothetical protein
VQEWASRTIHPLGVLKYGHTFDVFSSVVIGISLRVDSDSDSDLDLDLDFG